MATVLNKFSVEIISDHIRHIKKGDYNYYALPHMEEYKIKMINSRNTRCDAEVFVDGQLVGTWRIDPYNSATIERPIKINKRFTFVRQDSKVARRAGINQNDNMDGLVTVRFKPEKHNYCDNKPFVLSKVCYNNDDITYFGNPNPTRFVNNDISYAQSLNSYLDGIQISSKGNFEPKENVVGATVLGANTDQYFRTVEDIYDIDYHNITTINVRMMVLNEQTYISVKDGVKYDQIENKIPPIDDDVLPSFPNYDRSFSDDQIIQSRINIELPYSRQNF